MCSLDGVDEMGDARKLGREVSSVKTNNGMRLIDACAFASQGMDKKINVEG